MKKTLSLFIIIVMSISIIPALAQEEYIDTVVIPEKGFINKIRTGFKYEIKRMQESTSLIFASKLDKAKLKIEYAELRTREASKLRQLNRENEATKLEGQYKENIDKAIELSDDLNEKSKEEILQKIQKHLEVLNALLLKLPESGKKGVLNAISRSETNIKRFMSDKQKDIDSKVEIKMSEDAQITKEINDLTLKLLDTLQNDDQIKIEAKSEDGEENVVYKTTENTILSDEQKAIITELSNELKTLLASSDEEQSIKIKINADTNILDDAEANSLIEDNPQLENKEEIISVDKAVEGGDIIKTYTIYSVSR